MMRKKKNNLTLSYREYLIIFILITFVIGILSKDIGVFSNMIMLDVFALSFYLLFSRYRERVIASKIEERLPSFIRNIADAVESGIPIIVAIEQASRKKYGDVSSYFNEIADRLKAKLPFEKAIEKFERRFGKRKTVKLTMNILKELVRSGYGLSSSLNSLYFNLIKLNEMKKERKSALNQYLVLVYAITYLFIGIVIVINKLLVPIFSTGGGLMFQSPCIGYPTYSINGMICSYYNGVTRMFKTEYTPVEAYYFGLFFNIGLFQAMFAGLLVGMIVENSFISGMKHSMILVFSTFAIFGILTRLGIL